MYDRIQTIHPDPTKQGVVIDRAKYDAVRAAILATLREQGEVRFAALGPQVGARLGEHFEGSVSWYVTTVKLDLEARGEIERLPGRGPQRLRLTE